jgi:hypothetical protein
MIAAIKKSLQKENNIMQKFEYLFFDCPVTQSFLKSLSKQLKQYYKNFIFDIKEKRI